MIENLDVALYLDLLESEVFRLRSLVKGHEGIRRAGAVANLMGVDDTGDTLEYAPMRNLRSEPTPGYDANGSEA